MRHVKNLTLHDKNVNVDTKKLKTIRVVSINHFL